MAARLGWADAVTGAPSYTGRALRQLGSMLLGGATSARPLGAFSGVRPGTPTTIVTASSTTWTVTPFAGVLDGATAAIAGPYPYAFDTNQTGSVTAAGGSARVDRLDVQVVDPAEGGVGGANPLIQIVYTVGTPGLATAPAQSHPLAQINVPASGGGAPTVSWVAPYCFAAGGRGTANTSSQLPAGGTVGDKFVALDTGVIYRFNGTAWKGWDSDWAVWSPTITNMTVGNGTLTAQYRYAGGNVEWEFRFLLGSTSTVGASPNFTLPVTAETGILIYSVMGRGTFGLTSGSTIQDAVAYKISTTQVTLGAWAANGTYTTLVPVSSVIPLGGWTTNYYMVVAGSYRPA